MRARACRAIRLCLCRYSILRKCVSQNYRCCPDQASVKRPTKVSDTNPGIRRLPEEQHALETYVQVIPRVGGVGSCKVAAAIREDEPTSYYRQQAPSCSKLHKPTSPI